MSDQLLIEPETLHEDIVEELGDAIGQEDFKQASLNLESLPLDQRLEAWKLIPADHRLEVLIELHGEPQKLLIKALPEAEVIELFDELEAEDLLELADSLPSRLIDKALASMDDRQRHYYDTAQQYEQDRVGHWVNHEILVVPQTSRAQESLRVLRREVPDYTEVIYLVNRVGHWAGCVLISDIVTANEHVVVSELLQEDMPNLTPDMDIVEAAQKVMRSGYVALPVTDSNGLLLGRIDVRIAADILEEEYESQLMVSAGLAEDADLFAPVRRSAETRAIWLGINLLTALLASWFIGLFEATLEKAVVLAVLMPVVASMGGIAGSQTLTLIVRGLALGQVTDLNRLALVKKEFHVGLFNGALWAIVIGFVVYLWFDNLILGFVIAGAIVTNIVVAALSGVVIPVILEKLSIDPALSGSVILTTVTDVVGFVVFLGLGALLLT